MFIRNTIILYRVPTVYAIQWRGMLKIHFALSKTLTIFLTFNENQEDSFCMFGLMFGFIFYILVNSYGHVETFNSPYHTFPGQAWLSRLPVLSLVTDKSPSWIGGRRRMTYDQTPRKYGTGPGLKRILESGISTYDFFLLSILHRLII